MGDGLVPAEHVSIPIRKVLHIIPHRCVRRPQNSESPLQVADSKANTWVDP